MLSELAHVQGQTLTLFACSPDATEVESCWVLGVFVFFFKHRPQNCVMSLKFLHKMTTAGAVDPINTRD